jgi:hypothetical protein
MIMKLSKSDNCDNFNEAYEKLWQLLAATEPFLIKMHNLNGLKNFMEISLLTTLINRTRNIESQLGSVLINTIRNLNIKMK